MRSSEAQLYFVFSLSTELYSIPIPFFYVHSSFSRSFTQNVDALELLAGMDEEKLVEAHGSARGAHCLSCRKGFSRDWFVDKVSRGEAKYWRICMSYLFKMRYSIMQTTQRTCPTIVLSEKLAWWSVGGSVRLMIPFNMVDFLDLIGEERRETQLRFLQSVDQTRYRLFRWKSPRPIFFSRQ